MNDHQRTRLVRWFWRSSFSRRFSSGVLRNLKDDIDAMEALRNGRPNALGDFAVVVSQDFFKTNVFRINTVNTKSLILMLAQQSPLNFVSGQPVALDRVLRDYNRSEFHHLYPRAFLNAQGVSPRDQNALANFCFLSKVDNTALGGGAPSGYREHMSADVDAILERALCPPSLLADNYSTFSDDRAPILEREANRLMQ